jgi:hypothetical protein
VKLGWNRRSASIVAVAAFVLCLNSPDARAQTTCGEHAGPDIIVGDITGPANYTSSGTLEALSLGTTSCNLGTAGVAWIANTNQHPVIGGDLYRFKVVDGTGRFEQLGVSWVKHGFFALSQSLCCTCSPTDGTSLGVGCSDPYSASGNGTQSELGPRYVVSAHTGGFPYPTTHPTGVNVGRIQVEMADLEPSDPAGTRFFGSAQYVTPDDAAAGNQDNNVSYREMTVTGSGTAWDFGLTGTTQRELPAIEAWPTCETGVTTQHVRVPNEGLLILGYKATDLGGGLFHYEYAVYNMNSDAAVGSFSIPIPYGVTVTNVGFHGVVHRGGDGVGGVDQDATDWAATSSNGLLTWATTPYASNPNANAIRWGTTYNFRFDADSPPTIDTIGIGTFKGGVGIQTTAAVPTESLAVDAYCFGDSGSPVACPCGNTGTFEHGCENSSTTGGARAFASGSLSPDQLVITSSGERPTAFSLFLQASSFTLAAPYGDGLRCLTGTLKRIAAKNASSGTVSYPEGTELGIRARSAALGDVIPPGGIRYYQVVYRDASATFCPPPSGSTFNASNAIAVTWP